MISTMSTYCLLLEGNKFENNKFSLQVLKEKWAASYCAWCKHELMSQSLEESYVADTCLHGWVGDIYLGDGSRGIPDLMTLMMWTLGAGDWVQAGLGDPDDD